MKKAIKQKVETNNEIRNSYVVVVTRNKITFCYSFETFALALEKYNAQVKNESIFTSVINMKTIIGLYEVSNYGENIRICLQTKIESNRFS
jgi:hypothetical protein